MEKLLLLDFQEVGGYTITLSVNSIKITYCHVSPNYIVKENDIVYEKNGFELAIKDIENGDNLIEIEEKDELDTTEKLIQKVNNTNIYR